MKNQILLNYNKLIKYFLSILGIGGACTFLGCAYGSLPDEYEYGVPRASFKVIGKVTSEENNEIPNIRVIMAYDTSFTDEHGNYDIIMYAAPTSQEFNMEFKDIDGVSNGTFHTKDTIVAFTNPEFENGEGWNIGETSAVMNIKLKENKE